MASAREASRSNRSSCSACCSELRQRLDRSCTSRAPRRRTTANAMTLPAIASPTRSQSPPSLPAAVDSSPRFVARRCAASRTCDSTPCPPADRATCRWTAAISPCNASLATDSVRCIADATSKPCACTFALMAVPRGTTRESHVTRDSVTRDRASRAHEGSGNRMGSRERGRNRSKSRSPRARSRSRSGGRGGRDGGRARSPRSPRRDSARRVSGRDPWGGVGVGKGGPARKGLAGWPQCSRSAANSCCSSAATELLVPLIACVCCPSGCFGCRRDRWTASS